MRARGLLLLTAILLVSPSWAWAARHEEAARPRRCSPEGAIALLRSGTPKDIAWGAYYASRDHLTEAGALILQRLAEYARRPLKKETWLERANLIDAAIRLRLLPPKSVLLALAGWHSESITTLAVLHPRTPPDVLLALFTRFDEHGSDAEPWLALGNRMVEGKTPGFAAAILRGYRMHRLLRVWDREGPSGRWGCPSGSAPSCGYAPVRPGFPPMARWRLDLEPRPHYEVLITGIHPVYMRRWESTDEKVWFCSVGHRRDARNGCRGEWLAAWSSRPKARRGHRDDAASREPVPSPGGRLDLRYTGRQPWERTLRRHVQAIHEAYWRLARRLVELRLVTEEEARALKPELEITVEDKRDDKRHALPPLPEVQPVNPWIAKSRTRPRRRGSV